MSNSPRRQAKMRWCGAGIVELSSSDGRDICFVDASFWSNNGWRAFGVEKPPEYVSPDGLASYVGERNPDHVLVALTHDHNDHIADYFETLAAFHAAELDVKTVLQCDLGRVALRQRFDEAGLDMEQVVVFGGRGINIGGVASHGAMRAWMTPAVHSTLAGYPPVGYVLEVGGVRFYASGDTDLYGDMALVARYTPDVALVCVSNGRVTMGPEDAVEAVRMVGAAAAVPIHYAHNPRVRQTDAGPEFAAHASERIPSVDVHVIRPGDTVEFEFD